MNALHQLYSKKNLANAWDEHKSSFSRSTLAGVDGVSRADFANSIGQQIEDISDRIRYGAYSFQKLRPIAIPKSDGNIRLINVPTIRDRFVQKVLVRFLAEKYGKQWQTPRSFSSLQGTGDGVQSSLKVIKRAINKSDFVVRADLSKYFDTIDRSAMNAVIKKRVRFRSLHPLMFAAVRCETAQRSIDEKAIFQKAGLSIGTGIRQGMPLSPMFAFLFLMDLDTKVVGGLHRYVDDMLFFGPKKTEVLKSFDSYREAVVARGLTVHEMGQPPEKPKTLLVGPHENFEFLGVQLVRSTDGPIVFRIPASSKVRIERSVIESCNFDFDNRRNQKNWILISANKANNLIRNYRGAYGFCEDWDTLNTTLRQLQLNMCRRIVSEMSKIEKQGGAEILMRAFGC